MMSGNSAPDPKDLSSNIINSPFNTWLLIFRGYPSTHKETHTNTQRHTLMPNAGINLHPRSVQHSPTQLSRMSTTSHLYKEFKDLSKLSTTLD